MICTTTLYSYIDKGIFLRLTNKNLPVKKNTKRKYKKVQKQARASAGESIEKRPEEIDTREEFGHWEMDTVKGKRGKSKNSLLVLTERKTRDEIIFKLPEHTAAAEMSHLILTFSIISAGFFFSLLFCNWCVMMSLYVHREEKHYEQKEITNQTFYSVFLSI